MLVSWPDALSWQERRLGLTKILCGRAVSDSAFVDFGLVRLYHSKTLEIESFEDVGRCDWVIADNDGVVGSNPT